MKTGAFDDAVQQIRNLTKELKTLRERVRILEKENEQLRKAVKFCTKEDEK